MLLDTNIELEMGGTFVRGVGLCLQVVNSISNATLFFRKPCKFRTKKLINQIFTYISNSCPNSGMSTFGNPLSFKSLVNFC